MANQEAILRDLYKQCFKAPIEEIIALPQSGSYRQYFRINHADGSVLGVFNTDLEENKAYLSFSKTFLDQNISVPKIHIVSEDMQAYLVEDIGAKALWDIAKEDMLSLKRLSPNSLKLYKKTLSELLKIQTQTIDQLDLSYCYPRDAFDKQSMLWDLNYFKYFFLRLMRVGVDEQGLEDDIQALAAELNQVDQNYFLYRDFQSRNVMIKEGQPYFIDFQGGRRGSIYYDLASMLYDANVELIEEDRDLLINDYYAQWNQLVPTEKEEFKALFYKFSLIRLTQALGAFGLRGVVEKKPHFKECIPFALSELCKIIDKLNLTKSYPTLSAAIKSAQKSDYIKKVVTS